MKPPTYHLAGRDIYETPIMIGLRRRRRERKLTPWLWIAGGGLLLWLLFHGG
jgi:hypothetical protein